MISSRSISKVPGLGFFGRWHPVRRPKKHFIGLLYVLPAALLFGTFGIYTVVYGFLLSFARWNGYSPNWTWSGIENYKNILYANKLEAASIRAAGKNTLVVMIALPVVVTIIGLTLALLLNSIRRLRTFLRTIIFLPYVTSGIAIFYAWTFIYQPDGSANSILKFIGLGRFSQPNGFLGNTHSSLASVIVVMVWSSVPIAMLLYLTGLQTIPESVVEAAKVDGASVLRTAFSIILPLLNPITALIFVMQLGGALQNFTIFLLMTDGGPINSTQVLSLTTYHYAFSSSPDLGTASALGWLLAAAAIALTVVNFRILRSRQ
jgi:multiple sugar transport system permease protein/raffinose/stachyose/melibiose transport system permease protein